MKCLLGTGCGTLHILGLVGMRMVVVVWSLCAGSCLDQLSCQFFLLSVLLNVLSPMGLLAVGCPHVAPSHVVEHAHLLPHRLWHASLLVVPCAFSVP